MDAVREQVNLIRFDFTLICYFYLIGQVIIMARLLGCVEESDLDVALVYQPGNLRL